MLLPSLNPEQEVSRGRVAPTRETRPRRGPELERDGKGRKATSGAETGRGATRRDDEGRRGSRTVALNAVPSDRQHRLLHGSIFGSVRFSNLYGRSTPFSINAPIRCFFARLLSVSPSNGVACPARRPMPAKGNPLSDSTAVWYTR